MAGKKAPETVTVYHPTAVGVSHQTTDPKSWHEQGWLDTDPHLEEQNTEG